MVLWTFSHGMAHPRVMECRRERTKIGFHDSGAPSIHPVMASAVLRYIDANIDCVHLDPPCAIGLALRPKRLFGFDGTADEVPR
jgi:hypothetical protein